MRDALSGAVELAAAEGRVDRETAALALEELAAAGDESVSVAHVAFLLDLDEPTVEDLARRASVGATAAPREDEPSDEPDLTGTTLDGFEITGVLGEGGMGRVYRARQQGVHRDVALKVLPAWRVGDGEAVRRFLREGRAAAALSHPHVVTCHAMGRQGDRLWVAMELLPGGDLEARARKLGGTLPERRALALIRDAAEGLAALHEAGIVHRDVKPANVFLTGDGRAKIGDLGLACSRLGDDRVTRTGFLLGTPAYMAPEQAESAREDPRSDVYALGATLFRLLTGRAPYEGTELSILRRKLDAPPPDPRAVRPELSSEAARLVLRCMARRPEDRPATARALVEEIDATLRSLHAPRRSRKPLLALAAALVLVVVTAVALRPREQAPPPLPSAGAGIRPTSTTLATPDGGGWRLAEGPGDWDRTSFVSTGAARLPVTARFALRTAVRRDAPAGVLSEQGFTKAGGFFHEVGLRAGNERVDAGADLRGAALWLTLVVDSSGGAQGLLRALGPGQSLASAGERALVDDFPIEDAADVVAELHADETTWRFRLLTPAGAELRTARGTWNAPTSLHLWAHAGNWSTGRGSGRVEASAREP